jgi:ABC-type branched-subunit amino acid transport system permease subunit
LRPGGLFVTQFGSSRPRRSGAHSPPSPIWTAVGGRSAAGCLSGALKKLVEGALSDRLGYYWLLALGALFVATVVFFPAGLLGRLLALPLPRRLTPAGRSSPSAPEPGR